MKYVTKSKHIIPLVFLFTVCLAEVEPDSSINRIPESSRVLLVHIALQTMDVVTTTVIIQNGGVEMNPIMKPIAGNLALLITVKAAAVYMIYRNLNEPGMKRTLKYVNYIYAAVVANNLYWIIKGR